ncbi:hypothetical protein SAMN05444000_117101 [Shimia gijangensis]|uniref:Uncharacterized protein n=1 Tax=Shimia gijangensis TaxID=1470563 RepID=A0A1M6P8P8_9RHOB|nr:hypothetical protein [Shimia gijangensis]SHK04290.1 hypothetical protein SAMN05444000_117101 [Shimia gijangensis]
MQGSVFDYWQAIVGLIAVIGVWIAWRQFKGGSTKTQNTISHGDRNTQSGGAGSTENSVEHGDDNQQSG